MQEVLRVWEFGFKYYYFFWLHIAYMLIKLRIFLELSSSLEIEA